MSPDRKEERWARCLGKALRALRKEQGMSPAELAKTSGISEAEIATIERGEGDPASDTLTTLGGALRVGASGLVARQEQIEVAEDRRHGG